MGQYKYKTFPNQTSPSKTTASKTTKPQKAQQKTPHLYLQKHSGTITAKEIHQASAIGLSVNITRHLVNMPACELNPKTYTTIVRSLFRGKKDTHVEVWEEGQLKKEKMGLLLGVGQGAKHKPCLIHIKYRPTGARGKPMAFVGKGITFDTGGLDLKNASGMRLMKKDMGGSAAVTGLAHWAAFSGIKKNLDFYLAIAENATSHQAMRPGDVLTARNQMTVEIHNTDAEGRLALGDALDVAITRKEKPCYVVDIATLTGAVKVGLGSKVGGLFGNNKELVDQIYQSSIQVEISSGPCH